MRDAVGALWNALHSAATPIAVVLYGDMGLLEAALAEVASLGDPRWAVVRAADVNEALAAHGDALVLLVPAAEAETLRELEGSRDRFVDRSVPIVVFLRRGGAGDACLRDTFSLTSWLRGNIVDPDDLEPWDVAAARRDFEHETGHSPEVWLARERSAPRSASARDIALTYRALLLEQVDDVG